MECGGRWEGEMIDLMPSRDCGTSVEGEEEEEAMTSAHARRAAAQQLIRAMMMWRRCIGGGQGLGERAAFSLQPRVTEAGAERGGPNACPPPPPPPPLPDVPLGCWRRNREGAE